MTEVPTVEITDPTQDAVEVPASQPDCAEAAAEAPPPEGAMATDVPTVEDKVICRRCTSSVQRDEAICTPKFREDLRWTCKSCHAVKGQLARHGIELSSCLTEDDVVVAFYQDSRAERMNSVDKRLSFSQARGVLKKNMIHSSSRVDREGECGEYHPLAYWELRGYNNARIEELADRRTHPILGD